MAKRRRGTHARGRWPYVVVAIFVLSGFVFVASAVSAGGSDLRPAGDDVGSLLKDRSDRVDVQRVDARKLREDIDSLSKSVNDASLKKQLDRADKLRDDTGLSKVVGAGMRVTLTDAPRTLEVPGLDPRSLVVHQQDIQAFVNVLWSGGAQAITLQGERLISTTGIKCVGSTVLLDGVPYSPPYVIEAVGDPATLDDALSSSPEVTTYGKYATMYGLGLKVEASGKLTAKPYAGTIGLKYATAAN
ncbi:MAG: DUF881 domain-containing protein [Kineosporiaceae bacterium]|nr:DUF881 domain-containing protein [Aeromicrobium sp.]